MKKNICFLIFSALIMFFPSIACADIFGSLADRAGVIGTGLKNSGYIIAGIGLIFFSFMAIFGKVNWKTLAYIMLSAFVLSTMTAIISWVRKDVEKPVAAASAGSANKDAGANTGVQATGTGPEINRNTQSK